MRAASERGAELACRISGPGAAANAAQSTSLRTSATVCDEPSGNPAYDGTPVLAGTPGTISNCKCDLAIASTSVVTASTESGSPATNRTTSTPARASAPRILATSAGSPRGGRTSGTTGSSGLTVSSVISGSGDDSVGGSGSRVPTSASTSAGTSGSVNTNSAPARTSRGRLGSRPGSPGPAPTNTTRPGLAFRPRVIPTSFPSTPGRPVRTAR